MKTKMRCTCIFPRIDVKTTPKSSTSEYKLVAAIQFALLIINAAASLL